MEKNAKRKGIMEEKVQAIIDLLKQRYPESQCALHYEKDYELMISVRLSAQCTERTGQSGDTCPVRRVPHSGGHGQRPHRAGGGAGPLLRIL